MNLSRIAPAVYPSSEVVLLDCTMTDAVGRVAWVLDPPKGVTKDEGALVQQARDVHFWEFNSHTPDNQKVDVSQRLPISRQLKQPEDAALIRNYSNPEFVLGHAWSARTTEAAAMSAAVSDPPTLRRAPLARNWNDYPAVVELQTEHDIYALADIHGDYEKAAKLLAAVGLIKGVPDAPNDVQWNGGKSVLVCTGDFIDKWDQGVEVVELLRALETSAAKDGGRLVITMGNHEAEFLAAGGNNKKGAEFEKELRTKGIIPAEVAAGEDATGIGAWLRNRPIAAKVNDWFFCHAGNTFGMSVKQLEKAVETGVDKDGFGTFVLAEPNSILESRIAGVPWWMLGPAPASTTQANPAMPLSQVEVGAPRLRNYLVALGCNHLVVGHQPGKISFGNNVVRKAGEPFSYEGVLFLIDVGMSRGQVDGHGMVLKIAAGAKPRVTTMDAVGRENILWKE